MNSRFLSLPRLVALGAFALALGATAVYAQPKAEQPAAPNGPAAPSVAAAAGVLVGGVQTGSPAEKAGIARGDIILEANGTAVDTPAALQRAIRSTKAGGSLSLKLRHGDAEKTVSVSVADQGGRPWIGVFGFPALQGNGRMGVGPGRGDGRGMGDGRGFGMRRYGLPAAGAFVASVAAGSPAEKAGLKQGDVILSVDGTAVDAQHALSDLIGAKKVGDTVTLSVQSAGQGQPRDVAVALEKNPSKEAPYLGVEYSTGLPMGRGMIPGPGFAVPGLGRAVISQVAPDGPAAKAGLLPSDVITKVEGTAVSAPQQVADAVGRHKPGDTMVVTVYRLADGKETDITVTLGQSPSDATKAYMGVTMTVAMPGRGMMQPVRPNPPVSGQAPTI